MAAFNSVNKVRVDAIPSQKIPAGQAKGEVQVAYDEYVTLANLGAADTINTAIVIPIGARVREMTVINPTNGGTITLGIAGTPAKYGTFTPGSASVISLASPNTVEETLLVTCTVAATATGTYKFDANFVLV